MMLSTKPYLVRAFYEWIVDSECTPHIVINAEFPRCNVPQEYVENGEIVFNISPQAIRDLKINNETVEFRASFSGVIRVISAPVHAVLAIYAEENGQGMFFDNEEGDDEGIDMNGWSEAATSEAESASSNTTDKKQASHLRLVE